VGFRRFVQLAKAAPLSSHLKTPVWHEEFSQAAATIRRGHFTGSMHFLPQRGRVDFVDLLLPHAGHPLAGCRPPAASFEGERGTEEAVNRNMKRTGDSPGAGILRQRSK